MDRTDEGSTIQGQLLRQSGRREVAIYLRDGQLWVGDFIDGVGELIEPAAWFRFNCATPWARRAHRLMLFESAVPLSTELAARIEDLHRTATQQRRRRGIGAKTSKLVRAGAPRRRLVSVTIASARTTSLFDDRLIEVRHDH